MSFTLFDNSISTGMSSDNDDDDDDDGRRESDSKVNSWRNEVYVK
jgi:hypothetical protein